MRGSCGSGCSKRASSGLSREGGEPEEDSASRTAGGSVESSPGSLLVRLAKFLAHGGVASRRKAEEIIGKGVVTVGGEVVTDPARDVDEGDDVRVNGAPVVAEVREVWAVNKPAGGGSTAREPGERPAAVELVGTEARLYPVGRLDVDTTGLLLLTNDGELANRLTHPRYEVPKTYRVRLREAIADRDLERLRGGVQLEDGPT